MTNDEYQQLIEFLGRKFDQVDTRFAQVDTRFDRIEARLDDHDERFRDILGHLDELYRRLECVFRPS